jgi:hypothetical protein
MRRELLQLPQHTVETNDTTIAAADDDGTNMIALLRPTPEPKQI